MLGTSSSFVQFRTIQRRKDTLQLHILKLLKSKLLNSSKVSSTTLSIESIPSIASTPADQQTKDIDLVRSKTTTTRLISQRRT